MSTEKRDRGTVMSRIAEIYVEKTFDNAASDYEKTRPAYVPQIFEDIMKYKSVGKDSAVLEIGMGTGAAAKPFLHKGCQFTGLEPGKNLAEYARDIFRGYDNFSLQEQSLQEYICEDERFDLVYAATAFHWIPEKYGYRRVYNLLKAGGAFARFRYHAGSDKGRPALTEEIQSLYRQYLQWENPAVFTEADAKAIADLAANYGFTDTQYHLYHMTKDFRADEYLSLLRTYPDHMKLEAGRRSALFDGIYQAIIRNGGTITVYYTMDLELARKPGCKK